MGNDTDFLLNYWPIWTSVAALIFSSACVSAVALYRIKKAEERQEGFMTSASHTKDCKIASLEIKEHFRVALTEFGAKLLTKMDEQQKPILDSIKKNAETISKNIDNIIRLDRRTRHLKDAD